MMIFSEWLQSFTKNVFFQIIFFAIIIDEQKINLLLWFSMLIVYSNGSAINLLPQTQNKL